MGVFFFLFPIYLCKVDNILARTDSPSFMISLAIIALSIFFLFVTPQVEDASAIIMEPGDIDQYQIDWSYDSNSSRSVGLTKPMIKIADESSHKIVGYIADENGTRLRMYNDEQVVMVKYYLGGGFVSDWEIADRPYRGYFAILIPPEFVGKVESVKIFINNHMYTVNDGTPTSSQSWVFLNSALTIYKVGSIIHLGPLTLGLEGFLHTSTPIELQDEVGSATLEQPGKFDVSVFDGIPPRFLTHLRNVTIEFSDGIPTVWYESPAASDSEGQRAITICEPSSGSTFNFGTNIVGCRATDNNGENAYSYFLIDVVPESNVISSDSLMNVQIDIVPFYMGSNIVKTTYSPLVSVALLGNGTLNIREVNQDSLHFGPNYISPSNTSTSITDINADGFDDLILKFNVIKAGLREGYHENACLRGMLDNGETLFQGCDSLKIVSSD